MNLDSAFAQLFAVSHIEGDQPCAIERRQWLAKLFQYRLPKRDHIPGLDGLRGIACLLILVGHFLVLNRDSVPVLLSCTFSQYWSGVDLFFVLSGFVIFYSLARLSDRQFTIPQLFRVYVTSRAMRILPVYAIFLLAYFYLPKIYPRFEHDELFITSIPHQVYLYFGQSWYMAFWQRAGAGFVNTSWSLSAEVFLYALAFAIVCFRINRCRIRIMMFLVAVSYAARLYFVFLTNNYLAAYLLPVCRMDGFMIGGVIALLYSSGSLNPVISRISRRLLPILFSVFIVLTIAGRHFASSFSILFSYSFYAVFYSVILVIILDEKSPFLSKGALKYFGTTSYFIYLFHYPIIVWMKRVSDEFHWNVLVNFSGTLLATVGAATLSWFIVERPIIAAGKLLNRPILKSSK